MYLDPNFGSMIIQLIIGLIAGAGAYLMIARKKIVSFSFKKKVTKDSTSDNANEGKDHEKGI